MERTKQMITTSVNNAVARAKAINNISDISHKLYFAEPFKGTVALVQLYETLHPHDLDMLMNVLMEELKNADLDVCLIASSLNTVEINLN